MAARACSSERRVGAQRDGAPSASARTGRQPLAHPELLARPLPSPHPHPPTHPQDPKAHRGRLPARAAAAQHLRAQGWGAAPLAPGCGAPLSLVRLLRQSPLDTLVLTPACPPPPIINPHSPSCPPPLPHPTGRRLLPAACRPSRTSAAQSPLFPYCPAPTPPTLGRRLLPAAPSVPQGHRPLLLGGPQAGSRRARRRRGGLPGAQGEQLQHGAGGGGGSGKTGFDGQ
jgi:hypothetical protein